MVFVVACKNAQAEPLDDDRIGRPWFVLMGGGGELRWVMVGWESPPQRLRITGGGFRSRQNTMGKGGGRERSSDGRRRIASSLSAKSEVGGRDSADARRRIIPNCSLDPRNPGFGVTF